MKLGKLVRLPLLWIYLGPPVLRDPTGRDAMASLEGSQDPWNLLRVGWYLFFGAIAVAALWRRRGAIRGVLRSAHLPFVCTAVWLGAAVISSAVSPAPRFTFANSLMLVVAAIAALDLAVKIRTRRLSVEAALKALFWINAAVLGLLLALIVVGPGLVMRFTEAGPRLVGGTVANSSVVAIVAMLLGLYLAPRVPSRRPVYWLICGLACAALILVRSRWTFAAATIGLLGMWWGTFRHVGGRQRLALMALSCWGCALLVGVLVSDSYRGGRAVEDTLQFVVRDQRTLVTASGRTAIVPAVVRGAWKRPLGLGYAAGPRALLMSSAFELQREGVVASRIGNAHNMYVEVLGGAGLAAFAGYLLLLLWTCVGIFSRLSPEVRAPVLTLQLVLLLGGLVSSAGALPFNQASALQMVLSGVVLGASRRDNRQQPPERRLPGVGHRGFPG